MIQSSSAFLLTDEQFDRIRELVQRRTGLIISASRKRELQKRIGPFVEKAASVEDFILQLELSSSIDQSMVNALTIGETYFFRNHPHFAALRHEVIPHIIRKNQIKKSLKIWSAGCATGEEPYSIAILLERDFPEIADWNITILATDINTQFIRKAQEGKYTQWSFRGVDDDTIARYFRQTDRNEYILKSSIRQKVSFIKLNLSEIPRYIEQVFDNCDLILCRNVLIYFQSRLATQICEVFSDCLSEQGYLLLGHSEAFPSLKNLKTIYSHATYYYRKKTEDTSIAPKSRISLVPGLGPYDPEKMLTPRQHDAIGFAGGSPKASIATMSLNQANGAQEDPLEGELKHVRDLSMEGDLPAAHEALGRLERGEGKLDFRVYFLKALVADQENESDEALAHLKQAIFLNKQFVIGHYYQGVIAERSGDLATARRGYRNTCRLAEEMRPDAEVNEGGGIRAGRLLEIATERLKELELQHG